MQVAGLKLKLEKWKERKGYCDSVFFIEHFPKKAIEECATEPVKCKEWVSKLEFKVNEKKAREHLRFFGPWTPLSVDKMDLAELTENILFDICSAFYHDNAKVFHLED